MATADLLTMTDKKSADKQKALDSALSQIECVRSFLWRFYVVVRVVDARWPVAGWNTSMKGKIQHGDRLAPSLFEPGLACERNMAAGRRFRGWRTG